MRDPNYRQGILLCGLIYFNLPLTGFAAVYSYSTKILSSMGLSPYAAMYITAGGALFDAIITVPAFWLVEKHGRKKLLLVTLNVVLVCNVLFLILALVLESQTSSFASSLFVIVVFVYLVAYNLGPGPITYFIGGELVPLSASSASLAFGVAINLATTIVVTFVFYPFSQFAGGLAYLMFIIPLAFNIVVLYRKLPETRPEAAGCPETVIGTYQTLSNNPGEIPGTDDR